jgi:hypothetical protein
MKKLAMLGLALALSGCATSGQWPSTEALSERAKQIQALTVQACRYLPTIGTIANLLSGGVTAPAAMIAADICAAVTTAPLADGPRGRIKVRGVTIRGRFVR